MIYLISFLEGIITFISPCMLPMLPVYISYFAGGEEKTKSKTAINSIAFVLGFTVMFVLMGAFAGVIGGFFKKYKIVFNIVAGGIVALFGLSYMGFFNLNFLRGINSSFLIGKGKLSAFLLGVVFSVGWTPCVGAYLGSALMLASRQGSALKGVVMLLLYSLGLGIPFVIGAVLIDKLKSTFDLIKKNYKAINIVCGGLLVVMGVLMMTGTLERLLTVMG